MRGTPVTSFQTEFEAFVPKALQAAFDIVGHDDAVETIWVVAHRVNTYIMAGPVYRVSGSVAAPLDLPEVLPTVDIADQIDTITQIGLDASDLMMIDPRHGPTRIVVRYDVAQQTMNADFAYEPLRMGPDDTLKEVFDGWVQRLRKTGNDSAAD